MIATVFNDPILERTIIVVVIEADNLQRMKKADPISLESLSMGGVLANIAYPTNFAILIGYEEDEVELYKKARAGWLPLLQHLERGRKFLPQVDGPANSFKIPREDPDA